MRRVEDGRGGVVEVEHRRAAPLSAGEAGTYAAGDGAVA